jgi:hypothetical protein
MPVHPNQDPAPRVEDHDVSAFDRGPILAEVYDLLDLPAKLNEPGGLGTPIRIPQAPYEEGVADHEAWVAGEHLAERILLSFRVNQTNPMFVQDLEETRLLGDNLVPERCPRLRVLPEFVFWDQPSGVFQRHIDGVAGVVDEGRS